ncbi:MAG: DUF4397 domain-containing protein [Deltaproteobacteria bacterium]|nr:MAG: DUF4397 domain-containing protein [Deltaproteobacteria bacterium]
MRQVIWTVSAVAMMLMGLGGCSSPPELEDPPPVERRVPPPQTEAYLRVVFAGKHTGLQFRLDGSVVGTMAKDKTDSGVFRVATGEHMMRVWDTQDQRVLTERSVRLEKDMRYNFFVVPSENGFITHWEQAKTGTYDGTSVSLRVLHATPDAGQLDLWTRTANRPLTRDSNLQKLSYKNLSTYHAVPFASDTWSVRLSNYDNTLISIKPEKLSRSMRYTLILSGSLLDPKLPLRARLYAENLKDAKGEAVQSEEVSGLDVHVRLHHSATLLQESVRLVLNERVIVGQLSAGATSSKLLIPAGSYKIQLISNDSNKVLIDQSMTLDSKQRVHWFLTRKEGEFDAQPEYQLVEHKQSAIDPDSSNASLQFYQGVKDYKSVSVRLVQTSTVARYPYVSFQSLTGIKTVPPGTYTLYVRVPDLNGLEVAFDTIRLEAGRHYLMNFNQIRTGLVVQKPDTVGSGLLLHLYNLAERAASVNTRDVSQARTVGRVMFANVSTLFPNARSDAQFYIDNQRLASLKTQKDFSPYVVQRSGEREITLRSSISPEVLLRRSFLLEGGENYSVFLYDSPDDSYKLWVIPDRPQSIDPKKARVRLLHLDEGAAKANLKMDTYNTVFENVEFLQTKAFQEVEPGEHLWTVTLGTSTTALMEVRKNLEAGKSYTLVVQPGSSNAKPTLQWIEHSQR